MLRPAAFLCVFLALSAPSAYATDDYECLITSKTAPASAPQFSAYPAKPWHGNTTKIKLVTPIAREFRTELREYQKKGYGTDFAGRFKIYSLGGCGTSCTIWAAVDDQTGIARDAGKFNMVIGAHVMDDEWIEVRADSRLVILKGYSEGEDGPEGLTYLLWNGKRFQKLAFYPRDKVCKPVDIDAIP